VQGSPLPKGSGETHRGFHIKLSRSPFFRDARSRAIFCYHLRDASGMRVPRAHRRRAILRIGIAKSCKEASKKRPANSKARARGKYRTPIPRDGTARRAGALMIREMRLRLTRPIGRDHGQPRPKLRRWQARSHFFSMKRPMPTAATRRCMLLAIVGSEADGAIVATD